MSERITEADLQDIATKAARFRDGVGGEVVTLFASCCLDLAAEVRRLRALIACAPDYADGCRCPYCAELQAEAEAIRTEGQ